MKTKSKYRWKCSHCGNINKTQYSEEQMKVIGICYCSECGILNTFGMVSMGLVVNEEYLSQRKAI